MHNIKVFMGLNIFRKGKPTDKPAGESGEGKEEPVIIHDMKGDILDANEKAVKLFGYSKDELTKLNVREIVGPESFSAAIIAFKDLIEKG